MDAENQSFAWCFDFQNGFAGRGYRGNSHGSVLSVPSRQGGAVAAADISTTTVLSSSTAATSAIGSTAQAVQFPLPDTGQTKCYDASGDSTSCTGTGEDGANIVNPMSYTDSGNGMVTDNDTGLMWQKKDSSARRTWSAARSYCTKLSLGGHSDWRLPGVMELISIVDYGISDPGSTINGTYFPKTDADVYWSSTADAKDKDVAWYVLFQNGFVNTELRSNEYHVRCVRGKQGAASFTDNGNGTATDSGTGLMWQQAGGELKKWINACHTVWD